MCSWCCRQCSGVASNPLVHVKAVREVQQLKWELQQQYMFAQQTASRTLAHDKRQPQYMSGAEVPLDVRRMEVLRRVGLCTA